MRADSLIAMRRKPFAPPTRQPPRLLIVPNLLRGLVPSGPDQIWWRTSPMFECASHSPIRITSMASRARCRLGAGSVSGSSLAVEALITPSPNEKAPSRPFSSIIRSRRASTHRRVPPAPRQSRHYSQMSRPGNPYDNAKAESFMKTLKTEEVDGRRFRDINHARRSIGLFIDTVYNTERLHSALGYCPRLEFESNFALAQNR